MSAKDVFEALATEAAEELTEFALQKLGEAILNTRASDDQDHTAALAAEVTAARLSSVAIIRLVLSRRKKKP